MKLYVNGAGTAAMTRVMTHLETCESLTSAATYKTTQRDSDLHRRDLFVGAPVHRRCCGICHRGLSGAHTSPAGPASAESGIGIGGAPSPAAPASAARLDFDEAVTSSTCACR